MGTPGTPASPGCVQSERGGWPFPAGVRGGSHRGAPCRDRRGRGPCPCSEKQGSGPLGNRLNSTQHLTGVVGEGPGERDSSHSL